MPFPARPLPSRPRALALAIALLACSPLAHAQEQPAAVAASAARPVSVAAQPLDAALLELGRQLGVQVSFGAELTRGRAAPALQGTYTPAEALDRLLAGAPLVWRANGPGAFLIEAGAESAAAPRALDTVVVVGGYTPTTISELPRTVWYVTEEQIETQAKGGASLSEILGSLVPSLDLGSQSRTNYSQNMRGRSAQIMIDGVSLNSMRNISRQFDSISPFNIERIEVLSGASSVYGGGATGGIINIITKRGAPGPAQFTTEIAGRSGFEASDDLDWRLAQSISGGSETVFGRLAVAYAQNGAAYDAGGRQVIPDTTQTDMQYNRSLDLSGTLDLQLASNQTVKLLAQHYTSEFHPGKALYLGENLSGSVPVAGAPDPEQLDIRHGFTSDVKPSTERSMLLADYAAQDVLGGQELYAQAYWRREKLDFYPFPNQFSYNDGTCAGSANCKRGRYYGASQQNTDSWGLKTALTKDWDVLKLTYGLEYSHEKFNGGTAYFDWNRAVSSGGLDFDNLANLQRYPDYQADTWAAFLQADWRMTDALTLSGGVRQQHNKVDLADFVPVSQQILMRNGLGTSADRIPGGTNSYDTTLLNAGLLWKIDARQQTWLNYSEGFSLVDVGKYYGNGTYRLQGGAGGNWQLLNAVTIEGSELANVKTRQVELGWRGEYGKLSVQTAAFYAWSDKALVIEPISLSVGLAQSKVRNYGLEGQINYDFTPNWSAGANWLAIKSEQQDAQGEWRKQTVTLASPSKASLYGGWKSGPTSLRLQANRNFDLSDGDGNRIEGYLTFDLFGSYDMKQAGTLSFGVQNLFDRRYQTTWSQRAQILYAGLMTPESLQFNGRGRTFGLAYTLRY
ncbi:TonB-dependent siderophore receptor [Bordetella genomosp. 1]|uniref:TonB-dependent siderophore receptor n=1 Tax=Bordetella genomosp. 1 TaxID=1395607 RepID=A0A261SF30_9BORD|nr:TonB-dependent receptor [Bordetella genomosp. 1]OZI35420.1 TonB-dependent siderophore receptor [Bordetella genomosp. 1]